VDARRIAEALMPSKIQEILAPLDPHSDRIIRTPLSDEEVAEIEGEAEVTIPPPFREYLQHVGLFQDLTWGASPFEVLDRPDDIVSGSRFLRELLAGKHDDLLPFGHDGAGNYFALATDGGEPYRIHFVDHETGKVSKQKPFEDWLQAVVAKAVKGAKRRPPNERKAWCVQFSLPDLSWEEVRAIIGQCASVRDVDEGWTNRQGKKGDVITSSRRFELEGQTLKATCMEYEAWTGPRISFDVRERLIGGPVPSRIRQLHRLFQQNCPGYRLVDYGALDITKLKD
jgi:hypothetical protein